MRFKRPVFPEHKFKSLTLIALFNVLLIVLIFVFFMPFFENPIGLSVVLPRAITGEPLSHKDVIVSITKDNSVYVDAKHVSFAELKNFIEVKKGVSYRVLIKADHRAAIGTLVEVWDLFRQANVSQVNIATNE